jgi:hypothetical protein
MSNKINKISGSQEQQDRIDAIQKQMVDSKTFDAHVNSLLVSKKPFKHCTA